MSTQTKTAKHSTKFANIGKLDCLRSFLVEYENAVKFYINYAWRTKIEFDGRVLDVAAGLYDCPKFISTVGNEPPNTLMSSRALKCASGQALGIIKSITAKIRKLEFKISVELAKGNSTDKLVKKLTEMTFSKPEVENIKPNLNSLCVDFHAAHGEFDGFLTLKSLGKTFGQIHIPVKFHRQSNKLKQHGFSQKTSWVIGNDSVSSIWERQAPAKKDKGIKVGADQGLKTCISLSDGQATGVDNHGHSLELIIRRLVRCVKGSNGYKRAQRHRTNYINWSINQLNFDDISEIGYEDVKDIRKGKNSSALMKGWTYTEIASKMEDRCASEGVLLTKQGSIYRSQRCYSCGYVHNKNRNKKLFSCLHCGHTDDADLNGAKNHSVDIDSIPFDVMCLGLNKTGFFWKETGLFGASGEEITVPHINKS
jgi:hypothetical protein